MSRGPARVRLRRRSSRVVPAVVVAVLLLALGVLVALATIARLVNGSWPLAATSATGALTRLTWGAAPVVAAGVVLALLGLFLLLAGLVPGGLRSARLDVPAETGAVADTDAVISTRALARIAGSRADQVDGVDRVSASATTRRVRLAVTTSSAQVEEIRTAVTQGVTDALTRAGVRPVPRVSTAVRTKEI